jgi:DNA-binding response OmpR family regulator
LTESLAHEGGTGPGAAGAVLVAEGDGLAREALSRILQEAGYEVLQASGGPEALALFECHGPLAFVILDMLLPPVDGVDTACRVRALDPSARIVLDDGGLAEDLFESITDTFMREPFDRDILRRVVHEVIRRARADLLESLVQTPAREGR